MSQADAVLLLVETLNRSLAVLSLRVATDDELKVILMSSLDRAMEGMDIPADMRKRLVESNLHSILKMRDDI